jgi:hypothetical protein
VNFLVLSSGNRFFGIRTPSLNTYRCEYRTDLHGSIGSPDINSLFVN